MARLEDVYRQLWHRHAFQALPTIPRGLGSASMVSNAGSDVYKPVSMDPVPRQEQNSNRDTCAAPITSFGSYGQDVYALPACFDALTTARLLRGSHTLPVH
eukprot:1161960-Pelagomonas_calceolata.AAC.3